jgi:hypothetical protein
MAIDDPPLPPVAASPRRAEEHLDAILSAPRAAAIVA